MARVVYSSQNIYRTIDWSKLRMKNTCGPCAGCMYLIPKREKGANASALACDYGQITRTSRYVIFNGNRELLKQKPCNLYKSGKYEGIQIFREGIV